MAKLIPLIGWIALIAVRGYGFVGIWLVLRSRQVVIAMPTRAAGRTFPVVAYEDALAAMKLSEFLRRRAFKVEILGIPPDGHVDIDGMGRVALVLICGPKNSVVAAELIGANPLYEFITDGPEWFVRDRATGLRYGTRKSAEADTRNVAYVCRVRRYDGNVRTILHIAGLHAIGSLGACSLMITPRHLWRIAIQGPFADFSFICNSHYTRKPARIIRSWFVVSPRKHKP